ncbi:hypothetical protein K2X33_07505 [bacterium]|nr:hypothetical protein [bacterium]
MTESKRGSRPSSRRGRTPSNENDRDRGPDREPDHDDDYDRAPAPKRASAPEPDAEVDSYTLQIFFEPQDGIFCATFVEFPELRVSDESRQEAIYLAEDKLHSHLAALRQSGKPVPPPVRTTDYPSHIEIAVSQSLYRKLDSRRHQERVSMEQLITEILTSACERRSSEGGESRQGGGGGGKNRGHGRGQGQQRGGQGGGNRGGRGSFHNTMESRADFMEYVRNLEKGGGPGYKKR